MMGTRAARAKCGRLAWINKMNIVKIKNFIRDSNRLLDKPIEDLDRSPLLTLNYSVYGSAGRAGGDEIPRGSPFPLYRYAVRADDGTPMYGAIKYDTDPVTRALLCGTLNGVETVAELNIMHPAGEVRGMMYRPRRLVLNQNELKLILEDCSDIISCIWYAYVASGMHVAAATRHTPFKSAAFYQKHEYWTTIVRVHPANNADQP